MPKAIPMFRPHQGPGSDYDGSGREGKRRRGRRYDERRGSSAARGYGGRWQRARAGYLKSHPLCVCCEALGRVEPATVVDHVVPHEGDMALFWDSSNWQALCKRCHDGEKQRLEAAWRAGKVGIEALNLGKRQ